MGCSHVQKCNLCLNVCMCVLFFFKCVYVLSFATAQQGFFNTSKVETVLQLFPERLRVFVTARYKIFLLQQR